MADLEPTFDDCPRSCPENDRPLLSFCGSCPHREANDGFTEICAEQLDAEVGPAWRRYGLPVLRATVTDLLDLANSTGVTLSSAVERGIKIVTGERDRIRRIDEWNERQKARTR